MWCFELVLPGDLSESPTRLSRVDTTYAKGEQVVASGIVDALAGGIFLMVRSGAKGQSCTV